MGQATTGLYALLGSRSRGLKLHEWKGGKLETFAAPSSYSALSRHGAYLVAENPTVPGLWGALFSSLTQRHPLVLLPPCSPLEREVLLRQLPPTAPAGAVLVLFTSGTTGEPKAVFHSERSLLASAQQLAAAFPGTATTCSLLAPWGMAGVAFHCLLPAARGSSGVLFSGEPLLGWAQHALRLFRELGVELVSLNPFLLEMLLRAGLDAGYDGKVTSLTAPLKASQRESVRLNTGHDVLEIYGMTEAAGPVLLAGKSLGAELRLSDSGELLLRGEQLFLGYSALGAFTAREQSEWFATGDIFAGQAGGRLAHQGRTRELIDLGGRKVAPALIEAAFEGMPELAECLAFAKVLAGVERPALAYARAADCALAKDELSALVEKRAKEMLSPELRPAWWQEIEKVPRLKNGKPDRAGLKKLA